MRARLLHASQARLLHALGGGLLHVRAARACCLRGASTAGAGQLARDGGLLYVRATRTSLGRMHGAASHAVAPQVRASIEATI